MGARLSRRDLIGHAGIGAGALILGGVPVDPALARRRRRIGGVPFAREGSFPLGVASGDPASRSMALWTRLEGIDSDRMLWLEVARDEGFRRVVRRRRVKAGADRDFTAEGRLGGLRPGEQYFYRFETRTGSSPVGRFRTLRPPDSREPVRIALFTCQEWQAGYYGAHSVIAREDVDLVVCLGDYIYEASYQGPRQDTSGADGDGNVQTLADYRSKYRLYRSDGDLQAMHAAHAVMAIWDDHDVTNDWAGDQEGTLGLRPSEGPFVERRRAALRAFYEYLPIAPVARNPARGHDLYRRRRVGANVELFLLDERSYRDPQPCANAPVVPCPDAESGTRSMLGPEQLAWLKVGLADSSATWKLIGNQVMVMAFELAPGTPVYKDSWDGYGMERRELLGHIEARGIRDVAFLTGDFHNFFAGQTGVDGRGSGGAVAPEFVVGSITSLSDTDAIANAVGVPLPPDVPAAPYRAALSANPHIKYSELLSRGFGLIEARPDELRVRFMAVPALERTTEARDIGAFRVASGSPDLEVL
jgi:alkaline phosphatase D